MTINTESQIDLEDILPKRAEVTIEDVLEAELHATTLDDYADLKDKPIINEFFDTDLPLPAIIEPTSKYPKRVNDHVVTREKRLKVRLMKVAGVETALVAKCMGITSATLHKYYRQDLEIGAAEATALVTGKLMEKIRNGDTASIIFYLRTRGRWAPKNEIEITHSHTIRPRSKEEIESELLRIGVPPDRLAELTE